MQQVRGQVVLVRAVDPQGQAAHQGWSRSRVPDPETWSGQGPCHARELGISLVIPEGLLSGAKQALNKWKVLEQ